MHCNWLNGWKTLSILIMLLSLSSNSVKAAAIDVDDYYGGFQGDLEEMNEAVKRAASGWQNLHGGWGKRNVKNNKITDYVDQAGAAFASPLLNYEYDTSKADANDEANEPIRPWDSNIADNLAFKRSRGGNWNNFQNAGWKKREPGSWNNLRGLWGKRSSWGRLNGSWGRK